MTRARMQPVLVTGATGRVGRVVVARLLGAGVPVRALTRRPAAAGLPRLARPEDLSKADITSSNRHACNQQQCEDEQRSHGLLPFQ